MASTTTCWKVLVVLHGNQPAFMEQIPPLILSIPNHLTLGMRTDRPLSKTEQPTRHNRPTPVCHSKSPVLVLTGPRWMYSKPREAHYSPMPKRGRQLWVCGLGGIVVYRPRIRKA